MLRRSACRRWTRRTSNCTAPASASRRAVGRPPGSALATTHGSLVRDARVSCSTAASCRLPRRIDSRIAGATSVINAAKVVSKLCAPRRTNDHRRSASPSCSSCRKLLNVAARVLPRAPVRRSTATHSSPSPMRAETSLASPTLRASNTTASSMPAGKSDRTVVAIGADQRAAMTSANDMSSGVTSGALPSRPSMGFSVIPAGGESVGLSATTIPMARRPPNGTMTPSPTAAGVRSLAR